MLQSSDKRYKAIFGISLKVQIDDISIDANFIFDKESQHNFYSNFEADFDLDASPYQQFLKVKSRRNLRGELFIKKI